MALPRSDRFAFADIPSYHMTVFEGVIGTRRSPGHWPATLPKDALPAYATMLERLTRDLREKLPTLDLARPAFCRFRDMNAFPPILGL